jgi:transmembrane sensor
MEANPDEFMLAAAADWYARLSASDCLPGERTQFERWRQCHPRHAAAYARACDAADAVERLAHVDPRLQKLADRAYGMARAGCEPAYARRRWLAPAALAASIAVAVIGVRLGADFFFGRADAVMYKNAATEQRRIGLADGSIVHLDVGSQIDVRMRGSERRVELLAGRALFEVAHDASRPFTVFAGAARTTALGTRFQVARRDQQTVVTLAEGSVVVAATGTSPGWHEKLAPGEQLDISANSAARIRRVVDPLIATSWSRGRLVFRGMPLAEALEEVNRYAVREVRLGDPSLAGLAVSGNFVAGDGELAASAFAAVLPLEVVDGGSEIILVRRH